MFRLRKSSDIFIKRSKSKFWKQNKYLCSSTVNSEQKKELPFEADVVVIGGGSLGCNTLYHLAKLGITNTVLLECNRITAGTTWHTAGLVWRLRPSDTEIALINTTRDLLMKLEEETGINPGWINNGGLFIASNKARLDEYKRLMTIGRVNNIESYVLDAQETKKLYPLMNVDDVYGTLYSPGDGTIDPAGLCNALTRSATRAGAQVFEQCAVLGIATEPTLLGGTQVSQIKTSLGNIETKCVVNATGAWANDIANMVGVNIPLVPMKHAYVVTEKIPGIQNMPNVRDHDASVYLRLQGDALSVGGYENNPIFLDRLDRDFAFGLYDLDWEVFSTNIEGAINRVPALEKSGIKSTVCGPESFTPDHKPIMGEDPEVNGFYHCCGFNSAGMMMGGGCGSQMAKWVANGRPDYDMFGYDIRRYRPSLNKNHDWILSRSHESYAKNYAIVYPHDEPLAGRNQNKSSIHDKLIEFGCVFQERHGFERPGWFNSVPTPVQTYDWYGAYNKISSKDSRYKVALSADYSFDYPPFHSLIQKECMAARSCAALFDMSYFGQFYLFGADAQKAADWIFSANMQKQTGSVVYTCMLNEKGGAEADLTVSIIEDRNRLSTEPDFEGRGFYLAVGGAAALQNWAHVTKQIRENRWNVQLVNASDNMSLLSLQGPYSRKILETLSDTSFTNEDFPFSTQKIINIAGVKARALRLSFVGELGWELHIPSQDTLQVYNALMKEGQKYQLMNAGYRAMDSLSAEKGYVHWHGDLRPDDTPLEAGLGFSCKLKSSTPFFGRAALESQKKEGLKRKLITFTVGDQKVPLWGLEGIYRDDTPVGFLRRAEYAFYLGSSIAYGYVSNPSGETVTKDFLSTGVWQIDSKGEKHSAKLHLKHPFDPTNLRIKGIYPDNEPIGNIAEAIA